MLTANIAPPNSLLLVMDRTVGRVPDSMQGRDIAFTPTCIAIGTLSEHDGSTHVMLGDNSEPLARTAPIFDGVLDTPGRKLAVCSVLDEVILEIDVAAERTRVRVWSNDQAEPSEICILVSAVGGLGPI